VLTGNGGADDLQGLGGDDILQALDGIADINLDCGDGAADTAHVDAIDPASAGCEQVVVGS
jgi:hypothetical protein